VTDAIKGIAKDHGGLDILVNNAGVAINGLVMRFSDEQWQKTLAVNLGGAFHCIRAAASFLLRAKAAGRIINITSVVGEMGNGGQTAYAASKAGLIGLTMSTARELASRGVTCNAISPGYIETDMTADHLPEAQRAKLLEQIPLGKIGRPEEVADAAAFLAGPEAAYITGQVLRVNGGMLM
jgi:3-oxoacyl-[acyl-carrier protein] reductase